MVATFGDPEQIKKQENKSKVYLNESQIERIEEKSTQLKKMRKDRRKMKNAFVEYSDSTQIANFNMLQEKQIRDEKVTDASLDPFKNELASVSFENGNIEIFNVKSGKIVATFDDLQNQGKIVFNEFQTHNFTEDNLHEIFVVRLLLIFYNKFR